MTGGAGFIGSNLVEALVGTAARVRVLDDLSTGRAENLAGLEADVEVVRADIRDLDACRRATDGVQVVFHEAALPSVQRSVNDPLRTHDINATGTLNMLLAARDAGVERVVYASSSSVYGKVETFPTPETIRPRPISPYGVSKLAGENYVYAFSSTFDLSTIALRYFNVFGPRQNPASEYAAVVPRFVTAAIEGSPVTVFGDGEQLRDFTFVADVVAANLLAADAGPDATGRSFNIARGEQHSVNELLAIVNGLFPADPLTVEHRPPRTGDVVRSQADIGLARELLGYQPAWSFEAGVRAATEWFTGT